MDFRVPCCVLGFNRVSWALFEYKKVNCLQVVSREREEISRGFLLACGWLCQVVHSGRLLPCLLPGALQPNPQLPTEPSSAIGEHNQHGYTTTPQTAQPTAPRSQAVCHWGAQTNTGTQQRHEQANGRKHQHHRAVQGCAGASDGGHRLRGQPRAGGPASPDSCQQGGCPAEEQGTAKP